MFARTDVEGRGPANDINALYQRNAAGDFVLNSAGQRVPITTDPLGQAQLRYQERAAYAKSNYDGLNQVRICSSAQIGADWRLTPNDVLTFRHWIQEPVLATNRNVLAGRRDPVAADDEVRDGRRRGVEMAARDVARLNTALASATRYIFRSWI